MVGTRLGENPTITPGGQDRPADDPAETNPQLNDRELGMMDLTQAFASLTIPVHPNPPTRLRPIKELDQTLNPPLRTQQDNILQKIQRSEVEAKVRTLPAEAISRLDYYFGTLYANPRYRTDIQVYDTQAPQQRPARYSLEPEGPIVASVTIDLDVRNMYSHFALQRPMMDPTTEEDMQWIGAVFENLAAAGVRFAGQGEPGITAGRAVNSTTAWLRDAQVVILSQELMGANQHHLGALRRSVVLFKYNELTTNNIQTIIDVLSEAMRFIETFVIILPYPEGEMPTEEILQLAANTTLTIAQLAPPRQNDRTVSLVAANPPKVGTPNSVRNLYASMLGQNIGATYPSNQIRSNLYAVASTAECGNAQAPEGDIMLPHQFLRYLMDLDKSISFVLPRTLLYDVNGATSIYQAMELVLRARQRGTTPEESREALEELLKEENERPDLLTPATNTNSLRYRTPWEDPSLVAAGSTNMPGVCKNVKNWEDEIKLMSDEEKRQFSWRIEVKQLTNGDLDPRDKQGRAAIGVLNMLRVGGKYLEFIDTPHEENAWRNKKLALYPQAEWSKTQSDGTQTVPKASLSSLVGWQEVAKQGVDGVAWADLSVEDLIGTAAALGPENLIAGPKACKEFYESNKENTALKITILALMSQRAISFILGKDFNRDARALREKVAKSIIHVQQQLNRVPTLMEFLATTGLPLDGLHRCMDGPTMTYFFGPQSQRPADYSTFLGENLDCLFSIPAWIEGKTPRVLDQGEFPACPTITYSYTPHGISLNYNCIMAAINSLGFIHRLLGSTESAMQNCLNSIRDHQEKMENVEETRNIAAENNRRIAYNKKKDTTLKKVMLQPNPKRVRIIDLPTEITDKAEEVREPRTRLQVERNITKRAAMHRPPSAPEPQEEPQTLEAQYVATALTQQSEGAQAMEVTTQSTSADHSERENQAGRLNNSGTSLAEPARDSHSPAAAPPQQPAPQDDQEAPLEPPPGFEELLTESTQPTSPQQTYVVERTKSPKRRSYASHFRMHGEQLSDVSEDEEPDPDRLIRVELEGTPSAYMTRYTHPPESAPKYWLTPQEMAEVRKTCAGASQDYMNNAIYREIERKTKETEDFRKKMQERQEAFERGKRRFHEERRAREKQGRRNTSETPASAERRLTLKVATFQQGKKLSESQTQELRLFEKQTRRIQDKHAKEKEADRRARRESEQGARQSTSSQQPGPSRADTSRPPSPVYRQGKDTTGFGLAPRRGGRGRLGNINFRKPLASSFVREVEPSKYQTYMPEMPGNPAHPLAPPPGYNGPIPLSVEREPSAENLHVIDKWLKTRAERNRNRPRTGRRINEFGFAIGATDYEAPYYIEWMPPEIEICIMKEDPDPLIGGKWDYLRTFWIPSGKTKRLNPYDKNSGIDPKSWVTTWEDWCFQEEEREQMLKAKAEKKRKEKKERRERFEKRDRTAPHDTTHLANLLMMRPESPTPWYEKQSYTTLVPWRGAGEYAYDPRVDEPPSDDDWDPDTPTWASIPRTTTVLHKYPLTPMPEPTPTVGFAFGRGRRNADTEPDPKKQRTEETPRVGATFHAPDPRLNTRTPPADSQEVLEPPPTTLPPLATLDEESDRQRREAWQNRDVVPISSDDEADEEVRRITRQDDEEEHLPPSENMQTDHMTTPAGETTNEPQTQNLFTNIQSQLPTPNLTEADNQEPMEEQAATLGEEVEIAPAGANQPLAEATTTELTQPLEEEVTPMEVDDSTAEGILSRPDTPLDVDVTIRDFPPKKPKIQRAIEVIPPPVPDKLQGDRLTTHLLEQRVEPTMLHFTVSNPPIVREVVNTAPTTPPEQRVLQGLIQQQIDDPPQSRSASPWPTRLPTEQRQMSPTRSREVSKNLTRHRDRVLPTSKRSRSEHSTTRHASQRSRLYAEGKDIPRSKTAMQLTVPRASIDDSIPNARATPREGTLLNPAPPEITISQDHETKQIQARVENRNPRGWTTNFNLKEVSSEMRDFKIMLEAQEEALEWQRVQDPQPPTMIRQTYKEMALLAQRATNLDHVEYYRRQGLETPTELPYPTQGSRVERWCLYCMANLELLEDIGRLAQTPLRSWQRCKCEPSERFGSLEVHSTEREARHCHKIYKSCETFSEALEFLMPRLSADRFVEDIKEHSVVGLATDYWQVHSGYSYRKGVLQAGYPPELLPGYYHNIVKMPARLAFAPNTMMARTFDLKAPVGTDPVVLTYDAHLKAHHIMDQIDGLSEEQYQMMRPQRKKLWQLTRNPSMHPTSREELWGIAAELNHLLGNPERTRRIGHDETLEETCGTTAEHFVVNYHRDERLCMHQAGLMMSDKAAILGGKPYTIVAHEDMEEHWSDMGVPTNATVLGWDILADPIVATRYYLPGGYASNQTLRTSPERFFRSQQYFAKTNLPLHHIYEAISPPELSQQAYSSVNPLENHASAQNRARMLRRLMELVLKDRAVPEQGRDDLQRIYGSILTVNNLLKDRFAYPSPSRGEEPLPNKTRIPRQRNRKAMIKRARALDARLTYCKNRVQYCKHPVVSELKQ